MLEELLLAIGFGWMTGSALFVLGLCIPFLRVARRQPWIYRISLGVLCPAFLLGLASIGDTLFRYKGMDAPIVYSVAAFSAVVPICLCAYAVRHRSRTI